MNLGDDVLKIVFQIEIGLQRARCVHRRRIVQQREILLQGGFGSLQFLRDRRDFLGIGRLLLVLYGRDERIGVQSFYDALEFWYRMM